jgi:hypothetical protein
MRVAVPFENLIVGFLKRQKVLKATLNAAAIIRLRRVFLASSAAAVFITTAN